EDGWPNWIIGNHDNLRITSRVGRHQARIAAILLLTLRGTPTLYYGDEIGMRDVPIPADEIQDPQGRNMPDKDLSRDPARTPMQWDSSKNAGFTDAKPWLRLDNAYPKINVAAQKEDTYIILNINYMQINFIHKKKSLFLRDYFPVFSDRQILSYVRKAEN